MFQDTRSQRNVAALTADLSEVHQIMSRNIAEVLGQGEKLDSEDTTHAARRTHAQRGGGWEKRRGVCDHHVVSLAVVLVTAAAKGG